MNVIQLKQKPIEILVEVNTEGGWQLLLVTLKPLRQKFLECEGRNARVIPSSILERKRIEREFGEYKP